nr:hypothetical protein [Tanacetum cinerariifolium]
MVERCLRNVGRKVAMGMVFHSKVVMDVYATVDSCETAKEIWKRVRQTMKGSDIEEQEKKVKLFNEWEKFTSTDAFQLSAPTNNNQRTSSNPRNRQLAQPVMNMGQDRLTQNVGGNGENQFGQYAGQVAQNQQGFNACQNGGIQGVQNAGMQSGGNQNGLVVASTSGTQHDKAPVYDTDGSAKVQLNDNCYDNEIFNMFTQEEQYTDLLEPIPEPQLVPQNYNHVTSVVPSTVQSGGTVETSFAPNEETRAHQETVYRNLVEQVAQVNMINCNMRAKNAELKSELARYKIQEQRFEIRLVHTARTRRPQLKGNTRNAKVPSASKSSEVKKIVTVEDHRRTLLLSKNQKTMSSEYNHTMAQMLQAPIEDYEDAIVVPQINANNFELKQTLINLVQS